MKTITAARQFKVIIERDEDGFFVASVPALPGCHTQAKTYSELKARVLDVIKLCQEVAASNKDYARKIKQFAYEPSFVGVELISV